MARRVIHNDRVVIPDANRVVVGCDCDPCGGGGPPCECPSGGFQYPFDIEPVNNCLTLFNPLNDPGWSFNQGPNGGWARHDGGPGGGAMEQDVHRAGDPANNNDFTATCKTAVPNEITGFAMGDWWAPIAPGVFIMEIRNPNLNFRAWIEFRSEGNVSPSIMEGNVSDFDGTYSSSFDLGLFTFVAGNLIDLNIDYTQRPFGAGTIQHDLRMWSDAAGFDWQYVSGARSSQGLGTFGDCNLMRYLVFGPTSVLMGVPRPWFHLDFWDATLA